MTDSEKKMKKKDQGRDVPTDPNLLTAPSVLTGPGAGAPPVSSRETSNGSSATGGGVGARDCGNCPSCLITAYLDSHDHIVTEVVHISEGVWIGPDEASFNPTTFDVLGAIHDGIGAMAIEKDNPEAQAWWRGQMALALLAAAGLLD